MTLSTRGGRAQSGSSARGYRLASGILFLQLAWVKPGIQRSLPFWSGTLIMAFLGWLWWESLAVGHSWRRGVAAKNQVVAGSARGACYFFRQSWTSSNSISLYTLPAGRIESLSGPLAISAVRPTNGSLPPIVGTFPAFRTGTFQTALGFKEINESTLPWAVQTPIDEFWLSFQSKGVVLPYWLLMLAFALLWAPLLAWRFRRLRRKISAA